MVRAVWVGVAFVCGIALGVIGARMEREPLAVAALPAKVPLGTSAATAAPVDSTTAPEAKFGSIAHASSAALTTANKPPVPPAAADAASGIGAAGDTPAPHPVDVGAAFQQLIDRPSYPGFPNEFGDAHRTLERESRDDSWAYQLEAEIQNSLTADVSAGNFKVEFLECRTTVCEMRLSATEAHSAALNAWSESQNSMPWNQRLQSVGMSISTTNGGSEGLWLFRRPPAK